MKNHSIRVSFAVLLAALLLMVSGASVYGASSVVKVSGQIVPKTITQGSAFYIKGKISANKTIKRVEIGVTTAGGGKWTAQKYDNKSVNAKTFDIKRADNRIKFGKLGAGTYIYRIYVHTSDRKVHCVVNQKFTVKAKAQAAKTTTTVSSGGSKVTISGGAAPGNYYVGKAFKARGVVSSNDVINKVEVGIVVDATNKWSQYKYTANVGSRSFDLSRAANSLKFDMLPGGTFRYRMYAHTAKGVVIVFDKKFTVTPSGKTTGAINWAKKIAADSRFTYGKGYGGYFTCPVCAGKYGKNEAQFTCMPFLAAAYAHGTGNSQLMNGGRHEMYLNNENFEGKLANNWFKLGLCRDLTISDLQPGDVIIKYSENNDSGHAWMYGGGDSIIEAVPADIRVLKTGAAAKLKRYGSSEGTPSKNYVMRYRH